MAFLTEAQIRELSDEGLVGATVNIEREDSKQRFTLERPHGRGKKGVVWRGKDSLGVDVALKFVPVGEYEHHSLLDEMSAAARLTQRHFAQVRSFGDADLPSTGLHGRYKCIATEWIEGDPLTEFVRRYPTTVEDYLTLVRQLFSALAVLKNAGLCHDDLHPGNVLLFRSPDPLTGMETWAIKIIDTGTVKRLTTRERLLSDLRVRVAALEGADNDVARELRSLLNWKEPDDHLRAVECLLHAANGLVDRYPQADYWERRFIDGLTGVFDRLVEPDESRRLDSPSSIVSAFEELRREARHVDATGKLGLGSPFDYISAEMIRSERDFADLFSRECPWLDDCRALQPLYIYGPRGCGKSTVLRWLSFKTAAADPDRKRLEDLRDIGVYISCSVELRSRFWLLDEPVIERLQAPIVRYFSLLLVEELFDTLLAMQHIEQGSECLFGLADGDVDSFTEWAVRRMIPEPSGTAVRLEGQDQFSYLRGLARKLRWDTWATIQCGGKAEGELPDPALVSDICRELAQHYPFFKDRHITFLVDDYSNQRIPAALQRRLNKTISFAKQGTPIFKVSSEYNGVDLEGIQEGREVAEINIGAKYTQSGGDSSLGPDFLANIFNIRLRKAGYRGTIEQILGTDHYSGRPMHRAIAEAEIAGKPTFYYAGLETVHLLCSGDVALALDLVRNVFEKNHVGVETLSMISAPAQHRVIQEFAHREIHRIRYIVPFGPQMHDIIAYLGSLSRAFLINKRSMRQDKADEPMCKTHLDIRIPAIRALETDHPEPYKVYKVLTSRALMFSLETSRSRISGATERLQMRRIYFPAFKAAMKRDVPIKVDTVDELLSLLTDPKSFAERELQRSNIPGEQLSLALEYSNLETLE